MFEARGSQPQRQGTLDYHVDREALSRKIIVTNQVCKLKF